MLIPVTGYTIITKVEEGNQGSSRNLGCNDPVQPQKLRWVGNLSWPGVLNPQRCHILATNLICHFTSSKSHPKPSIHLAWDVGDAAAWAAPRRPAELCGGQAGHCALGGGCWCNLRCWVWIKSSLHVNTWTQWSQYTITVSVSQDFIDNSKIIFGPIDADIKDAKRRISVARGPKKKKNSAPVAEIEDDNDESCGEASDGDDDQ